MRKIDVQDGYRPSYALATFRVRSDLDGQDAYMRVYLQVPHKGTEFFPPNKRAKQAAAGYHREVEAMKAFHEQGSTITPALLAIQEDIQDKEGVIPGGYVVHIVFQRVPGVRLADDTTVPGYAPTLHNFFQVFSTPERDQIRMVFDKEYRELRKLGWLPSFPWATNLIWDSDASKLRVFLIVILGLWLIVELGTLLTFEGLTRQDLAMRMLLTMARRKRKWKRKRCPCVIFGVSGASLLPLKIVKIEQIFLSGSSSPGVHFPACATM